LKNKIKFIIFDLDGVLVDAKKIHYEALNLALGDKYSISWEDHLSKFDGLKTNQKLQILTLEKNLPVTEYDEIWQKKQKITLQKLQSLSINNNLIDCLTELSEKYKIAVCSNSIKKTVLTSLSRLGIIEFFDLLLSNEDVEFPKPHPEIYWKAMSYFGFLPNETLILEDSPPGLYAASNSKSNVIRINSPSEITSDFIKSKINILEMDKKNPIPYWSDEKLNVIIPMAGQGSRFEKVGYTFPKPLIDVRNKPMIQVVVENLNIKANYIYIVQKSHKEKYNLGTLLNLITPNCKIVEVDGVTEGAACSALLSKDIINVDLPLFFANSDQFVEWDSNDFFYKMNECDLDGGIVTFTSTHPKWSFARVGEDGYVSEVSEKNPISDLATVGFYYWKRGSDFVKYSEEMIEKNMRINGEFYVCPVYNLAINDGKKIKTYHVENMWGLGTPEDLNYFLENYK
jgi:HAD superfamily hydrolase (TIGR01509 family)